MAGKFEDAPEIQMVVFRLEKEEFAVDINQVREVLKLSQVTPLPHSPHYIEGVINLRGEVIPVVDLRKRFELTDEKRGDKARVIIVEIQNSNVGLTVDSVTEVLRFSSAVIQAPPSRVSGTRADLVKGIAKISERLLIILNLEKVLTAEESISLEEVTALDI